MASAKRTKRVVEFGDFQTPEALAREVCSLLSRQDVEPSSIVEPTCGIGNFLVAALDQFASARQAIGVDINPRHVSAAVSRLQGRKALVVCSSFFDTDWPKLLRELPEPVLVIGNPPWVTNADLGALGSSNLPPKSNFQRRSGLEAMTGKSNFDISEWMLIRMLEWLDGRKATMAMLCKTGVARKILAHAWKNRLSLENSQIYTLDTARYFGAAVDACLLICNMHPSRHNHDTDVYGSFTPSTPSYTIGYRNAQLVSGVAAYARWKHLQGNELYRWRSGIKHDCSRIMELRKEGEYYRNGLGQVVELEDDYLFPMLKSSDLASASATRPRLWMLVTQRAVGDDTACIKFDAPKTWKYLQTHAQRLDRRASSIYKNRPQFCVFGVGPYSFARWKVAISGFYKRLYFKVVGTTERKPIVLDDTAYFVPCRSRGEAEYIASLLNSEPAKEFYQALIFWDAKRPITVDVLRRLDFLAVARELGTEAAMARYLSQRGNAATRTVVCHQSQGDLFPSGNGTHLATSQDSG